MGLPGLRTPVTLTRKGQTSQAADGSPIVSTDKIWTKLGHYQMQQGTEDLTGTGRVEYEVYRFWLPFVTGSNRPNVTDIIEADGFQYEVIGIEQESFNHHLIVRTHRVQR